MNTNLSGTTGVQEKLSQVQSELESIGKEIETLLEEEKTLVDQFEKLTMECTSGLKDIQDKLSLKLDPEFPKIEEPNPNPEEVSKLNQSISDLSSRQDSFMNSLQTLDSTSKDVETQLGVEKERWSSFLNQVE